MVTCADASHDLVKELDRLASRHGWQVTWSVGWAPGRLRAGRARQAPGSAWEAAIDGKGQARERRTDEACGNARCAHPACRIEEAHVADLTGLLREGPDGDQLKAWPKTMRVFARRERPRPAPSCPCSRPPAAGATRCGPRTGCILLAWLKLIALDGDLVKAEPKTLRYLLHAAARLVLGGRRRTLTIAAA